VWAPVCALTIISSHLKSTSETAADFAKICLN
jgi:hypothetical protein